MTPAELTELFYQEKALQQGHILEVHITENQAFNSQIQHLKVSYSPDAVPHLPTELVLKKNVATDWGKEAGRSEVAFYRFIAQQTHRFPMIIPHVVATYDEQTGDSLLLLQDLSSTHHPPVARRLTAEQTTPLDDIPSETTLHQIVETLAAFHAAWWEHPQLGTPPLELDADCLDEDHFRDYCQWLDQNWQSCLAGEGYWLPQNVVSDISEILHLLPVAWERYFAKRFPTRHQITFLHTDAYLVNFLVPRTDGDGSVYMLDWQGPWGGMGAFDLVMMCASFWTSAQRQENQREETMLRRYFVALQAHGVTNYTWDQLMEDYRLRAHLKKSVPTLGQFNSHEPVLNGVVSDGSRPDKASLHYFHRGVHSLCLSADNDRARQRCAQPPSARGSRQSLSGSGLSLNALSNVSGYTEAILQRCKFQAGCHIR